ncbi:arylsulfatase [Verrucomicrobiales bacterium]|nr:arylsulfatase [Verrucomicrobiales bacterium]
MIRLHSIFVTACAALLVFAFTNTATAEEKPPNVVLIYADDLGIGMLGCYGQTLIKTPHIDKLAAEGMKFSNYYGGVFCAPARWTLHTGMHDGRIGGWKQNQSGFLIKQDIAGVQEPDYTKNFNAYVEKTSVPIPEKEVFMAQVAQQAGYKTIQVGKLDVGFLTNHDRVKRFGWDEYEGYYSHSRCHGFYPPYLWRDGKKFLLEGNTDPRCGKMSEKGDEPVGSGGKTYSQNVFITSILEYLRANKDEPFFLYHPTQLPHGPVAIPELHPDFADHPTLSLAEKKYASMIKMLDDHVGLIMQELKDLEIDDNTLVVLVSDNGHELYYGPKPSFPKKRPNGEATNLTDKKWRTSDCGDVFNGAGGRAGLKRSAYQGGHQCPLIARWPGKIDAGTESGHLSAHYDFIATLAEVVGRDKPTGKDGISYLPTLLGKPQPTEHDHVVINNHFSRMAKTCLITNEGWKLVEIDQKKNHYQLYDLNNDNEEHHDLAAKHPDRVAALTAILKQELNSPRPDLLSAAERQQ